MYGSRHLVGVLVAGLAICVAGKVLAQQLQKPLKEPTEAELEKIKAALPDKATAKPNKPRTLLIFVRSEGFTHSAIMPGARALELMGEKTGAYKSVISDDMAMFDPENLEKFDAVFFSNCTGLKFLDDKRQPDAKRRQALLDFVHNGKGVGGNHGAVDNFYNWPEAAAMMGALFAGHPWGRAPVKIDDPTHPLVRCFEGKGFWISDEMYRMKDPYSREKLRVLLSFDMSKLPNDKNSRPDGDNPIAWIQQVGKGRVFYCSLGHKHDIFWNPTLLRFFLDGVQYILGDLPADATPSAKLAPQPIPALAPEKP
jgi:type 1 glutamine amidotransferase